MDAVTIDDITSRLRCFAMAVKETRTHAAERSAFGKYRAGAPYFALYPLRSLLSSSETAARLSPEHHAEFGRVSRELAALEQVGSRAYREELFHDLSAYVEAYRTLLCYHELRLCPLDGIAHNPLREEIAVLVAELAGEFPLDDIRTLVASLDETFCILRELKGAITPQTDPAGGAAGTASRWIWECPCCSPRQRERTDPL
jgi:hypothetical protein